MPVKTAGGSSIGRRKIHKEETTQEKKVSERIYEDDDYTIVKLHFPK